MEIKKTERLANLTFCVGSFQVLFAIGIFVQQLIEIVSYEKRTQQFLADKLTNQTMSENESIFIPANKQAVSFSNGLTLIASILIACIGTLMVQSARPVLGFIE